MISRGQIAAKVRHFRELHPEFYCASKDCLWRLTDNEGNTISVCKKHPEAGSGQPLVTNEEQCAIPE